MGHSIKSLFTLALFALVVALSALSCRSGEDRPPEVEARRELLERIAPWDQTEVDERTVAVLMPCGRRLDEVYSPEEYAEVADTIEYTENWHRFAYLALWDLDSDASLQIGGDWGFIGALESTGDRDGVARLDGLAEDQQLLEDLTGKSLRDERCPFNLLATRDYANVAQFPLGATTSPVLRVEHRALRGVDSPFLPDATTKVYLSDLFGRMGYAPTSNSASAELWLGEDDASTLITWHRVDFEVAMSFLEDEGYERRVSGSTEFFANESLEGSDAFRRFILLNSNTGKSGPTFFADDEARLTQAVSAVLDGEDRIPVDSALSIVANVGARAGGSLGAFALLTPEAAGAPDDVDWSAASLSFGRVEGDTRVIAVSMYFEDADDGDQWAAEMPDRMRQFESSDASRMRGAPPRPFSEWCESIDTDVEKKIDGALLNVRCIFPSSGYTPPWTALIETEDLAFLR